MNAVSLMDLPLPTILRWCAVCLFHTLMLFGLANPVFHPWVLPLTPLLLLGLGLPLLLSLRPLSPRSILFYGTGFCLGLAAQAVGLSLHGNTAHAFASVLGPQVAGVPLIFAFQWVVMIYLSGYLASLLSQSRGQRFLLGTGLLFLLEVLAFPAAAELGLGTWATGWPSLSLLAGSALMAAMGHGLVLLFRLRFNGPLALPMAVGQSSLLLILPLIL